MEALANPVTTALSGPYENSVSVYHSNGLVWASVDQWSKVLQAPYFFVEFLRTNADIQSALLKGGRYTANCGGIKVYRWPPIAAAMDLWHRQWMVKVSQQQHVTMPTTLRNESEQFARRVAKLKFWGWELQERELQAAMNSRMSQEQSDSGMADTNQAMQAIQNLAQATQVVFEDHGKKIASNEQNIRHIKNSLPAFRDPDEFISVKQRCLELSLPFGIVVIGKLNLTQACGQSLKNSGAVSGGSQVEKLDGQSLTTSVTTWRRKDIDKAIKYYMPNADDPSQLTLL